MGFLDKLKGNKKNNGKTSENSSKFVKDVTWITTSEGEKLPNKIALRVENLAKQKSYTFHYKLNPYFEYTTLIDSISEIVDFCFGGDLITITYSVKFNGSYQDFEVDYNILDSGVYDKMIDQTKKIKAVRLGDSPFYKYPSNIVMNNLNLDGDVPDMINRNMLSHCLIFDNSLFLDAKVGGKLKADINKISPTKFSDDYKKKGVYELKVKRIEFVSRLRIPGYRKNILMVENIAVFREK